MLLSCFALSGTSPYTFTWVAPPGSSSLSRATNDTQPTSSELTFFAFEEDDGEYQCIIADSSTTESDTDDLTVGRYNTQCSNYIIPNSVLFPPQFQP